MENAGYPLLGVSRNKRLKTGANDEIRTRDLLITNQHIPL